MKSKRAAHRLFFSILFLFVLFVFGCGGGGGGSAPGGVSDTGISADTGDGEGTAPATIDNPPQASQVTDGQDITLQWTESIDAPYLTSYRVYYYTVSNDPESLQTADYAAAYSLADGTASQLNPSTDPKPITISKTNTQITLHFANTNTYYFVVTAVDTRGLESVPTSEVTTASL